MVISMINLTLYKKEMKQNMLIFLIFVSLTILYGVIVSALFDPVAEGLGWMQIMQETYPEMLDFIGFNVAQFNDYQYFVSGYLYGMLFILFGLIYINILSNRLIYRYLDRGSIVLLLATPNSRTKIIITQIKVLGTNIFALTMSMFLITGGFGAIFNPAYVDFGKLFYLNISFCIMLTFICSVMVLCHCLFEGKLAQGLGIGLPIIFFFMRLVSNLGDNYEIASYFTPFSLFNPMLCINYDALSFVYNGILIALSIVLFGFTLFGFNKRDLSI